MFEKYIISITISRQAFQILKPFSYERPRRSRMIETNEKSFKIKRNFKTELLQLRPF